MMSVPALKTENNAAIFKQNCLLLLKCCLSLGGNLDFLDFLQKKFYNIN